MQQLNWTVKLLSINQLPSGFVHSFRLEFVLESTKTTNNCKPIIMIAKSDIPFLRAFFNTLKTFPLNQFRSTERRKLCLRESNFKNFQWEHTAGFPPPPLRSTRLRHELYIRYFLILPKTLPMFCKKG